MPFVLFFFSRLFFFTCNSFVKRTCHLSDISQSLGFADFQTCGFCQLEESRGLFRFSFDLVSRLLQRGCHALSPGVNWPLPWWCRQAPVVIMRPAISRGGGGAANRRCSSSIINCLLSNRRFITDSESLPTTTMAPREKTFSWTLGQVSLSWSRVARRGGHCPCVTAQRLTGSAAEPEVRCKRRTCFQFQRLHVKK